MTTICSDLTSLQQAVWLKLKIYRNNFYWEIRKVNRDEAAQGFKSCTRLSAYSHNLHYISIVIQKDTNKSNLNIKPSNCNFLLTFLAVQEKHGDQMAWIKCLVHLFYAVIHGWRRKRIQKYWLKGDWNEGALGKPNRNDVKILIDIIGCYH